MGKKANRQPDEWREAQRRCRLSDEEVRMAKALGFRPRSLITNIPSRSQLWKAPVSVWIREYHAKCFGAARGPEPIQDPGKASAPPDDVGIEDTAGEQLLAQYDTVTDEPYFSRVGDGRRYSLEEAGKYLEEQDRDRAYDQLDEATEEGELVWQDDLKLNDQDIEEENHCMLRRQEEFRAAAQAVAAAMGRLAEVQKIALFGSVAKPLAKEIPRFRQSRRAGLETFHECKDVDLAVWISDTRNLRALQKSRSQALNELLAQRNIGVAHHQVDVFLLEAGTDRYLGRLCRFAQCPKGKAECCVAGCGAVPLLQQHEEFPFNASISLAESIDPYAKDAVPSDQGAPLAGPAAARALATSRGTIAARRSGRDEKEE